MSDHIVEGESESAHETDGAVHAHVATLPSFMGVFVVLAGLTALTVGQSYFDLGTASLLAVIVIASLKASLVILFFMHLKYDNRFFAIILVSALLFIGIFFAYTLNDTDHRGDNGANGTKVLPRSGEKAPGGMVEPK